MVRWGRQSRLLWRCSLTDTDLYPRTADDYYLIGWIDMILWLLLTLSAGSRNTGFRNKDDLNSFKVLLLNNMTDCEATLFLPKMIVLKLFLQRMDL